jgi:hypothetical protein
VTFNRHVAEDSVICICVLKAFNNHFLTRDRLFAAEDAHTLDPTIRKDGQSYMRKCTLSGIF